MAFSDESDQWVKEMGTEKKKKRSHTVLRQISGWTLTLIQTAVSALFIVIIALLGVLPAVLLGILAVVVTMLVIITRLLMSRPKNKVRFYSGAVFSIIICVVLIIANLLLLRITNVLENITGSSYETTIVGVYVLDEDPAQTLEDAADYTFGYLSGYGRSDTDYAVEQINKRLGIEITKKSYSTMLELADALYAGESPAIILGDGYVDVIADAEGYETFSDDIRLLYTVQWEEAIEEEEDVSENVFTVLISGIDTDGAVTTKSRSDVNILAVVNRNTHQVQLISTPRDYYVELSISDGVKDKLTHSGIYGVQVTMDTLGMLYDVDVDYYFRINFTGFTELIDAMGGITVTSEVEFTTGEYTFVIGENEMDGEAALAFVRERYAFSSGDRQRGKNQMAVIQGVIAKAQTLSFLQNFSSFLEGVESSFQTNVPSDVISDMVKEQIAEGGDWNVASYSVDGTGSYATTYSMSQELYVMIPDEETVEHAKELIEAVLAGEDAGE